MKVYLRMKTTKSPYIPPTKVYIERLDYKLFHLLYSFHTPIISILYMYVNIAHQTI